MKGSFLIWLILGLAIFLFIPLPYYQQQNAYCESSPPQLCYKQGWHVGLSLWDKIYPYLLPQPTQQTLSDSRPPVPPIITNHPYKEPSLSADLKEKYFPVWKEAFLKTNKMTEDYFSKYIVIENISKLEWNEGEAMSIRYLLNVDWSSSRLGDSVLIRPKGGEYFTQEQVKQNLLSSKVAALYQNQISRVVPVETIVPYKDIVNRLKEKCYQSLLPAETRVEQGVNRGYGELHLYANGTIDSERNECKAATVRIEDGKIVSCVDTPCRIN